MRNLNKPNWLASLIFTIFIATSMLVGSYQTVPSSLAAAPLSQEEPVSIPIYLPLQQKNFPRSPFIFGVETNSPSTYRAGQIEASNAYYVRHFALDWSEIEPVRTEPPTYDWSQVNEVGLQALAQNRLAVIATVKYTPAWAQKYAGIRCGPPSAAAIDEFAQFMAAAAARYGAWPYNIQHWEIGNEVDVANTAVGPDSGFGCWGEPSDAYYGGGYYADVLKQVTPAVKAANPQAKILTGGFLLDCDPDYPAGKDCKPSRFLEGILRNGGGPYFDIVSYHSFGRYQGGKILESFAWSQRGGNFLGKIVFLRQVLAQYGVTKPLMLTETSLICPNYEPECKPASENFKQRQADYVLWAYLRGWVQTLDGVMWYTIEDSGWLSSSLYQGQTAKPSFHAFAYAATLLEDAKMNNVVTAYPGVEGYEFLRQGKKIWVIWSQDQLDKTIELPDNVLQIYDKFGVSIGPTGTTQLVNSPIYIEIQP